VCAVFKDFAMTKAEQVRPTPVVLTRRDSLKRGAAALVRRRNLASSTVAIVAPADPAEPRPLQHRDAGAHEQAPPPPIYNLAHPTDYYTVDSMETNGTSDGVRTAVKQFTTSGPGE
jgi:hypothetical protein